jgi:hypothetical protein
MTRQQTQIDQWDGTDVEPSYPRYRISGYLTDIENRDADDSEDEQYYRRFTEGDRFS